MLVVILLVLFVFWLMGYGPFDTLDKILLKFNGSIITLWNFLIFLVLIWLVTQLPSPFRQIAIVFILIWVLSILGIIAIAGLPSMIVISIIVGILLYVISGGR